MGFADITPRSVGMRPRLPGPTVTRRGVLWSWLLSAVLLPVPASADHIGILQSIDFETRAGGTPFVGVTDTFNAAEYASTGVLLEDSFADPFLLRVDLTDPSNVGTAISGYHLIVPAATGPTSVRLIFPLATPSGYVAFDFANLDGAVDVVAHDAFGSFFNQSFSGTGPLNTPTTSLLEGSALVALAEPILQLDISSANANQDLLLDNLTFLPVPEPSPAILLGTGLAALVGLRRRRAS